jgi:protein-L-isoaspartate(D-aspartate) O-methyltransferase
VLGLDRFRSGASEESVHVRARARMVAEQIAARGIRDPRILEAVGKVPRHLFVPAKHAGEAYDDHPVAIGHEQTISQPYVVAFMTEALGLVPGGSVLEVGTGSGYQAAVLAELVSLVYTIEIVASLAEEVPERLGRLGYTNVNVRSGDG